MAYIRRSPGPKGSVQVQVVEKGRDRRVRILEHVGTAHNKAQVAALMARAREVLNPGQQAFDLRLSDNRPVGPVAGVSTSRVAGLLCEVLESVYDRLGLDALGDEAFKHMVFARLIEPGAKTQVGRLMATIGLNPFHVNTYYAALARCGSRAYRERVAHHLFEAAACGGDLSLVLYDVTTLYFEAEDEDAASGPNAGLRRVGYSKERRVDPQIVVGLLVDRTGFPLEVSCWEGNRAETHTLLPTIQAFQDRHNIADFVVVADAGMLSAANLKALDEQGLRFIVGARQTRAPHDLESHFHWHGDAFSDGQIIDTITPRNANSKDLNPKDKRREPAWDPTSEIGVKSWRAIWQYTRRRAARDRKTLTSQYNRAQAIINGEIKPKTARFLTTTRSGQVFNDEAYQNALRLVGLKGYVTNLPAQAMSASEVIASYHELWHVEQSFRMSKTDLRARPIFHHTRNAIEAHLTVVITALAMSRYIYQTTGITAKKLVRELGQIQQTSGVLNGQTITLTDPTPKHLQTPIQKLTTP